MLLRYLIKFQKRVFNAVGPAISDSVEPLEAVAPHHHLASQSLFYRYYFGNAPVNLLFYFLFLSLTHSLTHSWSTGMLTGSIVSIPTYCNARRPIPIASFQVWLDYGVLPAVCFLSRLLYEQTRAIWTDNLLLWGWLKPTFLLFSFVTSYLAVVVYPFVELNPIKK